MHDEGIAVRVADLLLAGMTRRAIDHPSFERPFTGLRLVPEAHETDAAHRHPLELQRERVRRNARNFAVHMHEREFFSHVTAAVLWDLPLPGVDMTRLDVSVVAPHRAPRGRGVRGHQLAAKQVSTTRHEDGFMVASPASTWAQLGRIVRHPYDLTAIADAIILTPRVAGPFGRIIRPPLDTIESLAAELSRGRRVGIASLEEALRRTRPGAVSRPETWVRLTIIDAGLPEPRLDHDVYDDDGEFVGCVDLAYPELKIAIEYEGDQHRVDQRQWNRDIAKHDRLVELGWRVIRVTRSSVFDDPGDVVRRVRTALRARS